LSSYLGTVNSDSKNKSMSADDDDDDDDDDHKNDESNNDNKIYSTNNDPEHCILFSVFNITNSHSV